MSHMLKQRGCLSIVVEKKPNCRTLADAGAGCLTLLGIGQGTSYWIIFVPLVAMGGGLGLRCRR